MNETTYPLRGGQTGPPGFATFSASDPGFCVSAAAPYLANTCEMASPLPDIPDSCFLSSCFLQKREITGEKGALSLQPISAPFHGRKRAFFEPALRVH
jgi:hypothetical protein